MNFSSHFGLPYSVPKAFSCRAISNFHPSLSAMVRQIPIKLQFPLHHCSSFSRGGPMKAIMFKPVGQISTARVLFIWILKTCGSQLLNCPNSLSSVYIQEIPDLSSFLKENLRCKSVTSVYADVRKMHFKQLSFLHSVRKQYCRILHFHPNQLQTFNDVQLGNKFIL